MSTISVAGPKVRSRVRVNEACVTLLRAVMAEGWRPETAARDLVVSVHDDTRILRLLHAKLARLMLERPTRIINRAEVTLDHALSAAEAAQCGAAPAHVGPDHE